MKILDLHSHWGTRRAYVLRTEAELAQQRRTWNSEPRYVTEAEMAEDFRRHDVRTILDLGFTKRMSIAEAAPHHDYALDVQRQHPDAIFGLWLQIDPRSGAEGVDEFRRCMAASAGFVGVCISAPGMGYAASDPIYDPFYEASIEAGRPVLVLVGFTGSGAGLPGGGGIELELCHPHHIDRLAIRHPSLSIIAGRNPWPWPEDMLAVMLHKPNVWIEFHGWSPKYLSDSWKRDIARRLKDRVLFGADYPLFTYERLINDWQKLDYGEAQLRKIFFDNALALFPQLAQER